MDGVTYEEYEKDAEENIRKLHHRLNDGKYQCQPLRRVYIPKENVVAFVGPLQAK